MLTTAQETLLLQAMLPAPLLGRLNGYITAWGDTTKLLAFTRRIGAGAFATLVADYYGDKLFNMYMAVPALLRDNAMITLAGLSAITRGRIADIYPHVVINGGGYLLNTIAQAAIMEALLFGGIVLPPLSGPNIPLNPVTGLLGDPTRANQLYTVLSAGAGQKNYIFNAAGICIAEVDFGNHGGDAVSGHCHPFGLPGCVAFAHHNAGGVHVHAGEYPAAWATLPVGILPAVQLGH